MQILVTARLRALLPLLFFAAALAPATPGRAADTAKADTAKLVVVELFTSQGCSSCPPADRYLGELARRPGILALSYHVDYWNYIGWDDPYASRFATERQRAYARQLHQRYVYTPEMVVDGAAEGVGSERRTIGPLVAAAAADSRPRVAARLERQPDGSFAIHVDGGTEREPATLWLVGFDREHTTHVLHGENEGETLKDYQVVRSAAAIGIWRGKPLDLVVPAAKAAGDGGAALLVQQDEGHGRIIGAAVLRSPES